MISNSCCLRLEIMFFHLYEFLKNFLFFLRFFNKAIANNLLEEFIKYRFREVLNLSAWIKPKKFFGGICRYFNLSVRIDNCYGIGKTVEGFLCCLLRAVQFSPSVTTKFAQACSHIVEGFREPSNLIAGIDLYNKVEVSVTDFSVSYTHLRAHETRHELVC